MSQVLEMQFTTVAGKTSTISVDAPRQNVTVNEVHQVMQTIIEQNVFEVESAAFVAMKGAQMIERQVDPFDVTSI